ncbi:hypothetical protein ABZU25_04745 [Micromonospora sp. NPDC005215]|uniref:hypothetical protein n=1 Tax=Micromonospora sp. NPDC005215 TaxID=3157024 RepID=UPI0033BAED4F
MCRRDGLAGLVGQPPPGTYRQDGDARRRPFVADHQGGPPGWAVADAGGGATGGVRGAVRGCLPQWMRRAAGDGGEQRIGDRGGVWEQVLQHALPADVYATARTIAA